MDRDPTVPDLTPTEELVGCFCAVVIVAAVVTGVLALGLWVVERLRAEGPASW